MYNWCTYYFVTFVINFIIAQLTITHEHCCVYSWFLGKHYIYKPQIIVPNYILYNVTWEQWLFTTVYTIASCYRCLGDVIMYRMYIGQIYAHTMVNYSYHKYILFILFKNHFFIFLFRFKKSILNFFLTSIFFLLKFLFSCFLNNAPLLINLNIHIS